MAAPDTGRWFGFGFNGFGQTVSSAAEAGTPADGEAEGSVLEPRRVTACSSGPARGEASSSGDGPDAGPGRSVRRVFPAWSHTAALADDASVYFWGFVADSPWRQMHIINRSQQGCKDILSSEKYLMTLWPDRVECWDIPRLCRTREATDAVIWTKHLQEEEKPKAVFPLIPGGYITTSPPFYKSLPSQFSARKLVLGSEHALLLTFDGTVHSWGSGRHGQLGHGSVKDQAQPRIVEALHGLAMTELAAGTWHSACTSASGDLYVWGWNESGQLGLPTKSRPEEEQRRSGQQPELCGEGTQAQSDASGGITKSSTERAATGNANVFISIQAFPALLDFPGEVEISKVSCGSRHTAAITRSYGQLGHGQSDSTDLPKLVEYFVNTHLSVLDVVCGPWNTFVLAQRDMNYCDVIVEVTRCQPAIPLTACEKM
ncbi:RCC1 domain-containing protein 1-like isoform X2 [Narcine bancroftii]|uniref:RCC1 domain-containing protein 1-like isoform X2 n=1 Tax=Narcine bancroftii TaxID=1343680 RepID=UPI003831908C